MKKTILTLGTALALSGVLTGCNADRGAYNNNPNAPRNVTYRTDDRYNPDYTNRQATDYRNPGTVRNDNVNNGMRTNRSLAKRIADRANRVAGVDRTHVVVTPGRVLIGLDLAKGVKKTNVDQDVRSAVRPLTGNRDVYVSSDIKLVRRITNVETNVNAGAGTREVRSDITGIIDDLSNAIKRPFQNNSK
ncbi:sporulation protein [Sporolactobacillus sp. THM7-4]|nr:sporulation protein [Sporolactobacillus sp. THM7-4]